MMYDNHVAKECDRCLRLFLDDSNSPSCPGCLSKTTKPRCVVRKSGLQLHAEYMQPDGSWGDYRSSKRFRDQHEADNFARRYECNYGIFKVSLPRAKPSGKHNPQRPDTPIKA